MRRSALLEHGAAGAQLRRPRSFADATGAGEK
ncbi:Uncharacterized protein pbN1_12290 [Aromatoleum bremense]|nr:Uncharacterized protein pbN1_12290 [Aromatoleum bremense]